jgi:hypothetical protein
LWPEALLPPEVVSARESDKEEVKQSEERSLSLSPSQEKRARERERVNGERERGDMMGWGQEERKID